MNHLHSLPQTFAALVRGLTRMSLLVASLHVSGQEILLASRTNQWAYWDQGALTNTDWRTPGFDEASWKRGTAPLGYGDGDEATVVASGPDQATKWATIYFRHEFVVNDPAVYEGLQLHLQRDDGAVIYVNGREILRDNMPAGDVAFATLASTGITGAGESAYQTFTVGTESLQAGVNVVAVEVHQSALTSSDLSFDLELTGQWVPLRITPMVSAGAVQPFSSRLEVSIDDPIATSSELTVKFYARAAGPGSGRDFHLVVLPDTQYYTSSKNGGTPDMFIAQTEWILNQRGSRNIVFVTQLGDCVENGDNGGNPVEWLVATNALYRLEDSVRTLLHDGIPYGFAPGNHDLSGLSTGAPTSVFYNQFFGVDHFADRDYYGGHHGTNNNNNYHLFSASGLDFIIVHFEYDTTPEADVLNWANQVLRAHANRRAIVVSHYLLEKGEQAAFGAQGQAVYNALKDNPNLFMMLAGHVPGEGRRQDTWNGRTVHTLMSDFQGRINGGDGWLRLLEFSPSNNVVRVRTYSPTLDQYETDADSQFTLEYDMSLGGAFSEVGQRVGANSENHASLTWTNLAPLTTYEWYAEVTDGVRTTTTPIQRFTTPAEDGGTSGGGATEPQDPSRDSDGDGQTDVSEAIAGTNPNDPDSVLRIQSFRIQSAQAELRWSSEAGIVYRVCGKRDLNESAWTDLSGDIAGLAGVTQWSGSMNPSVQSMFFAVRVVAPAE